MVANLFLHIRTLDTGRVIGTPIPFVDESHDGTSVDEVRAAAVRSAREELDDLSGSLRSELAEHAVAELAAVEIEAGKDKLPVRFGLVVVQRAANTSAPFLVYAPEVPRFVVAVRDRGTLHAVVGEKLAEFVAEWRSDILAAAHERGQVELEPLPVTITPEDAPTTRRSPIETNADDLTERATQGRGPRLDRREPLVERVLAALAADGRASVLLVGPGAVGKTTLVHEVAARLAEGAVPPALQGKRLLRLSANELIAGARYIGEWQGRARDLVQYARQTGAIIAMGDPTGIVDAGRWSESSNNLGRYLRPAMEAGDLRLICETTQEGLAATRTRERSFVEVFYRVDVPEPTHEGARQILGLAARRLEANHGVEIDERAVQAALGLTDRFEPYRAQPGKGVRLLEETVQMTADASDDGVGRETVTRAFASRSGMPLSMLSDEVNLDPVEVRRFFEDRVLGQDESLAAMVDLISVVKAGLNDPAKPLGSFLFVGPTGVGKTELSKALAEFLFGSRDRVLRFDMGEYASSDAVPKLIGSAWQRDDEGELTRRVREQPFCVVLLDEIEKAHPVVFDVLLSALGEGRLTDAAGETADLRSAIVIMTSNLGAGRGAGGVGFATAGGADAAAQRRAPFVEEAETFFRPEFFNRIDRLLVFDRLDEESLRRIARRELGRILMREGVTRRRLLVEADDDVVEHLVRAGFDPRYGARPLHRAIERSVVAPLARLLMQRSPAPGDLIRIRESGGAITIDLHAVREAAPAPTAPPADAPAAAPAAAAPRRLAQIRELRDRVHAAAQAPAAQAASAALTAAVHATNAPDFWDRPDEARDALARSYELQRVFDDLRSLTSRVDGLVELASRSRSRGDGARATELREAQAEIEERLALTQLELASAGAGDDASRARVTCTPLGAGAEDWARALVAMYAAWAQRTARGAEPVRGDPHALTISGLGAHALLAVEQGLHRREGASGRHEIARVTVTARGRRAAVAPEPGAVVRVYSTGRRTGVRDPRSGVVVGNVRAVLEQGRIDEFILAGLAQQA